ncbi:MAG: DUF2177 family protein [Alphaproteobacteria bacterium]|nr:DUF2177 family protein [Alphaproteobacteria bacterium]
MLSAAAIYVIMLVVMAILDLVWISQVMGPVFQSQLSAVISPDVNMPAAIAFYLIYPAGITLFAVAPALKGGGWSEALLWGALFGFFAYATYDLTNLATLRVWSLRIALMDIAWGTFVTGASATLAVLLARLFRLT